MSKSRDLGEFPAAALDIDASGAITTTGPIDGRDVSTDGTKLDTIESSADVTDTSNVTASGALMDSELASIASVKALNQGVATTDDPTFTNTHLAAIDATIAATAVDTFVYDTRKDSDGGAWRKRTQHTSWYNEALNTSTRGSRKEFPAVAVIVAESNKVTIYDGDDPSMPMWMVFDVVGGSYVVSIIGSQTGIGRSVAMLNGQLSVGADGGFTSTALHVVDFIADTGRSYTINNSYNGDWPSNISTRNTPQSFISNSAYIIVAVQVNDVAMTVLPNAPIDPATGLPVPTIAVATNSGVSVIKDNGTVVDITNSASWESYNVAFRSDNAIVQHTAYSPTAASIIRVWHNIPTTDVAYDTSDEVYGSAERPNLCGTPVSNNFSVSAIASNGKAFGFDEVGALTLLDENTTTPSEGSVAYITSDYNTGWMNGDIKLATLSDTDATDVVGTELVTNGTFASNTNGWTASDPGCSLSLVSNQLRITNNDATAGGATTPISVVAGKLYTFSVGTSSGDVQLYLGASPNTATYFGPIITNSTTWTSTVTNTVYLMIKNNSTTNGATIDIDNISVRLAEEDRSVNANGLQVNGTITKSAVATGADLVAYSGFSASNHLQQPYNADLDFGTGDFSIMGWIKIDSVNQAWSHIIEKDLSESYLALRIHPANATLGGTMLFHIGNSEWALTGYSPVGKGWVNICLVRSSGKSTLYANGVSVYTTATHNGSVTNPANPAIYIRPTGCSLANLRISATAPSTEQIAKIYQDEKSLFQENAQATLYGTSNAVTALAYDDDTELLHAGTSSGRSVFQGLRRVDNTTTAVGVSISASNSMVLED